MIRSLALGLVLATGALAGKLPPGEGQTPPFAVVQLQPPAGAPSIVPPSKKPPVENLFQTPPQNPPDPDVAASRRAVESQDQSGLRPDDVAGGSEHGSQNSARPSASTGAETDCQQAAGLQDSTHHTDGVPRMTDLR